MAAIETNLAAQVDLLIDVQQFLFFEAELLDDRRFEQWLDLLTEDCSYRMPIRRNVPLGQRFEDALEGPVVAWFDDDKATLSQRVRQIQTGEHWAEEPLSRVSRLITNVRLAEVAMPEVTAHSKILVYRNRLETTTDLFVGRREDVLRRADGQWKIARRKVVLDQNVLLAKNLTIFF